MNGLSEEKLKPKKINKVERLIVQNAVVDSPYTSAVSIEGFETVVAKSENCHRFIGFKLKNVVQYQTLYKSLASGWHYLAYTVELEDGSQILDTIMPFKPMKKKVT